jgi:hypothetical protein
MQVDEIKLVMQKIDEVEAKFAKRKAEYESTIRVLQAMLRRMGKEMIAELESLPPEQWPKELAPVEDGRRGIPPKSDQSTK